MADINRRELILETLRGNNRFVTVQQLARDLYVSEATIRRDLTALENARLLRRTRGGAVLLEGSAGDDPLNFRENRNVTQKQIIAQYALRYVKNGMTLFLDSSSTVYALARGLGAFSGLRVVTTGLKTAMLLSEQPSVQVMCTGGALREGSKSLVGQAAQDFVARLNADAAFMSCRGFSLRHGACETSEDEYYIKRLFIQNSKQCYLMCDSTKMDADYLFCTAPLARFSAVITERRDVNEALKQAMEMPL